jgi:hypothetical protein
MSDMGANLMRKRKLVLGMGGAATALLAMQLIPMESPGNPPVEQSITQVMAMPADVEQTLRRACFDCHSNETSWPWYSRVAPARWLVASDVSEGREELNFSTWNRYAPEKQAKHWKHIAESVGEDREMPLWFYVPLHPEAKLSEQDRALIQHYATSQAVLAERSAAVSTLTER